MKRPCAAAMRPYVKLLWPVVIACKARCVHVAKQVSVTDEMRNQEFAARFTRKQCKEP